METLEKASNDLTEARAKIDAVRRALEEAPDDAGLRSVPARLDQVAAELDRVEKAVSAPLGVAVGK